MVRELFTQDVRDGLYKDEEQDKRSEVDRQRMSPRSNIRYRRSFCRVDGLSPNTGKKYESFVKHEDDGIWTYTTYLGTD